MHANTHTHTHTLHMHANKHTHTHIPTSTLHPDDKTPLILRQPFFNPSFYIFIQGPPLFYVQPKVQNRSGPLHRLVFNIVYAHLCSQCKVMRMSCLPPEQGWPHLQDSSGAVGTRPCCTVWQDWRGSILGHWAPWASDACGRSAISASPCRF